MDANAVALLGFVSLLIRLGHALHTIGSARARGVADAIIRATLDTAAVALAMYAVGRVVSMIAVTPGTRTGFSVGLNYRIEGPAVFFNAPGYLIATIVLALIPAALVAAATAERARVGGGAVLAVAAGLAGSVGVTGVAWALGAAFDAKYSVAVASAGPFVGAHLAAAAAGLAAAIVLGPRAAKYNRDGSANFIPPHQLPLAFLGDVLLVVALPALPAILTADPAARLLHGLLAASTAVIGAAIVQSRSSPIDGSRRLDSLLLLAAAVSGSIVGSLAGVDLTWPSLLVGFVVGIVLPTVTVKLDLKFRVDDPTGLTVVHLLGGLGGALVAGVGLFEQQPVAAMLGNALVMLGLAVASLAIGAIVGGVVSLLLKRASLLRIDPAAENEGVDLATHDVNAYPDFQQTMIKSYHLRQ